MDADKLVKMANQIGQFFETEPDPAAARTAVAGHLTRFWAPRMRLAITARLQAQGAASGLTPLVADAVKLLGGTRMPVQARPTADASDPPAPGTTG